MRCYLVLVVLSLQNLQADENLPLIEIVTESAFTLSYQDKKNQKIKGYAVELVKAILEDSELEYNISILPWIRAFRKAEADKNILIFPMGRTARREGEFKWIGELIPISYSLYCLTTNLPSPPLTIEQIRKEPIAVPRNDIRAAYLKENNFTNLVLTSGNEQTHKLIDRGRITFFISSALGLNQLQNKYNIQTKNVTKILEFKKLDTSLEIALSLSTSDEIVNKLQKSYSNIRDNGKYLEIMKPLYEKLNYPLPER
ncbi:MAG: polar amino acid transport system substrate-binding protein [Enterobacterales bacterium]|jgi:polar amino acid transport system substrate-binding protein